MADETERLERLVGQAAERLRGLSAERARLDQEVQRLGERLAQLEREAAGGAAGGGRAWSHAATLEALRETLAELQGS